MPVGLVDLLDARSHEAGELEQEERNADALALAAQSAREQISTVVAANRSNWRKQAMRELAKAKARYEASIAELEAARDGLSDEATLIVWLDGGAGGQAATDLLGGRTGTDRSGRQPVNFSRTIEELRLDCEHLAEHPGTAGNPSAEPRLELAWRG